ncbi:predicted protein [Naegleria gruberi]|uniref:Microsomal glutathione S-transferase 1 n=1 Tax=Naegleria gruberi TaxID=5762 RepID=D2W0R5_NAEGR|nr:uncharacterized protein NAEGRDRAFT_74953 [Naegleria gruberi]EFC37337.1 predicted protein [Naegleria gruberi]|eukprot:XP_002670081.1 predicted protein [Naegleria gruberi strain NEG-M]
MPLSNHFHNTPVLSHFLVNVGLLNLRLFLIGRLSAIAKRREKTPATVEDLGVIMGGERQAQLSKEQIDQINNPNSLVNRTLRIHRNDIENSLPFVSAAGVMVLLCLVQDASDEKTQWIANSLMYSYSIARFVYVYAYWNGKQPHRSISWILGFLTTAGILGFSYKLL